MNSICSSSFDTSGSLFTRASCRGGENSSDIGASRAFANAYSHSSVIFRFPFSKREMVAGVVCIRSANTSPVMRGCFIRSRIKTGGKSVGSLSFTILESYYLRARI